MSEKYAKYKIWKLPHPLLIHWILNPGLCINEVILGQRIPKVSLVDKTPNTHPINRHFVECPHCQTIHNQNLWSKKNALWHYMGWFCPTCGDKIPTLTNVFSLIFYIILFPIWKPLEAIYGERFKAWELRRLEKALTQDVSDQKFQYLKSGIFFGTAIGLIFFVSGGFIGGWTTQFFLFSFLSGAISGIVFGCLMKLILTPKRMPSFSKE